MKCSLHALIMEEKGRKRERKNPERKDRKEPERKNQKSKTKQKATEVTKEKANEQHSLQRTGPAQTQALRA